MRSLCVITSLLLVGGCSHRACEDQEPGMQVTLELTPDVASAKVATLHADISAAGLSKKADLDVGPLRSNRRATFVILVGDAGTGGFVASVSVRALDVLGNVIAQGAESFSGSGDACNAFSLLLSTDKPDGGPGDGPVVDGPVVDGVVVDTSADAGVDTAPPTYTWKTDPTWGSCSKKCDGGTRTRNVWCERGDGTKVSDGLCSGTKPAASQSCNPQPCCSTDTLVDAAKCDGDAKVQWVHWDSDTGSASDRASCGAECTKWATGNGYNQWCCQLYEDSSSGTNWVCRTYDSHSTSSSSSGRYAGLGQCQTP